MAQNIPLSKMALRGVMLHHYKHGIYVRDAAELICEAFGPGTVSKSTCCNWYQRFESDDYSLEDQPRSGRPEEINDDALLQVIEADPMQTARQLAVQFSVSHVTIINHLRRLGKVSKLGKWVPHELTEANKQARVTACQSLLWRSRRFDWLESVITMDEKWVLYSNVRCK